MRTIATALAATALLVGCGSTDGETRQEQGSREFNICLKQADRIAEAQGATAAKAKIADCRDAYANGTY